MLYPKYHYMKYLKLLCIALVILGWQPLRAQEKNETPLKEVIVEGFKTVNGLGHLPSYKEGIIYEGKKTEIMITDSLTANKAINNTRQILGRIPGLNIVETESSGFTANGIATRGLNPTQSIEMNTRQNGYTISADIYGYNEAYYIPAMEAVGRIELVRGAASLQFGPQFGGLVNYVIKEAPKNKVFEFRSSQTMGSFGLFNFYNSVAGTYKKWSYFGFLQYRILEGERPNSQQSQISSFGKIQYNHTEKLHFGLEYSLLRNRIQMPGGLSDSLFKANPKASTRARNFLKSPWNILSAYSNYAPTVNSTLSFKSTYLFSGRALVWRNEDGGAAAKDLIDPSTAAFEPREVGIEKMRNSSSELRYSLHYGWGNQQSTVAGGFRHSYGRFKRQGGGEGSVNSNFDLSITGPWGYDLNFTTSNLAPFIENIFKVSDNFTITPGFRFEYLRSTVKGHKEVDGDILQTDEIRNRSFALAGLGLEFNPGKNTAIYANISQVYRPIDYSQLEPFGSSSKIDRNLKDSKGFNSDLGYRGTLRNFLNFDVGLFYLAYEDRIGLSLDTDPISGDYYSVRKNIANSVHKGVEAYIEFNIIKYFKPQAEYGFSVFNSFSIMDAKYTSGAYKGKRVEAAAQHINRLGLILSNSKLSTILLYNFVGDAFGDASNTMSSEDPIAGYIPSYTVWDCSSSYKLNNFGINLGVTNILDQSYFTRRTDEYPGPGIIPALGRSFYLGFTASFQ